MATTVQSAFQRLKENLEITGLQKTTVSTRQDNVRSAVERDFNVLESFLTGSYSRSTMIAPLSDADVDVFVVLHSKYFERDRSSSLLDQVRKTLLKRYPNTPKISRNGQAVTITFGDFLVDVVPAFHRKGGGYLIPNSLTERWIATNPKIHVDLMTEKNQAHNGDLVPIVKMIKGWNRNIDFAFVSFRLELLAMNIFEGVTITNFSSGMRYFFDKGREKIKYKAKDPVPYGGEISGLRNASSADEAINRFTGAYHKALMAEEYAQYSEQKAIEVWKEIFGNYFPSYG